MTVFYNEFDSKAAAWLRELISAEQISTGVVDERSITELSADDVRGHERVHLFAGIGGWDYALQLAGWTRPVWTGSCPCQPFSVAGKRKGVADTRHLWPEMFRLIRECRPPVVFGEQVASRLGREWLSGVRADLETLGYAVGAADLCAAGVGAPHIRQRLYWVAYAKGRNGRLPVLERQPRQNSVEPEWCSGTLGLAYAGLPERRPGVEGYGFDRENAGRGQAPGGVGTHSQTGRMGHTESRRLGVDGSTPWCGGHAEQSGTAERVAYAESEGGCWRPALAERRGTKSGRPGAWDDYRLIWFRDGKTRRIEPGIEPLVDGLPRGMVPSGDISLPYVRNTGEARIPRLKGYGNAIVPQVAAAFVRAFMEAVA